MNPKYRYRDIDDTRKLDKTVHALNDLKEYQTSFATSCHPMAFTRVFEINLLKITITFRFNITTVCPGIGIPVIITIQSWEPIFIIGIPMLINVQFYNKTTPAYLV